MIDERIMVDMKVFCISYQRTGTTSVGRFLADHGLKVATYQVNRKNSWTESWFQGDFESIFQSEDFKLHDAFEDDPWWCLEFYKHLFHRFPHARFVHFQRDADRWFESMIRHSNGMTLGNTYLHSRLYQRENDFARLPKEQQELSIYSKKLDMLLPLSDEHRQQYISVYNARNNGILQFFRRFGPERLFHGRLEESDKWTRLGTFLGLTVSHAYDAHEHKARVSAKQVLE